MIPRNADKYSSGSLYRHAAPSENPIHKAGEWNRYTVRAQGPRIEVWSNGKQILDANINEYSTLRHPPLKGYIGLQDHGVPAEFRNVRYLMLEPKRETSHANRNNAESLIGRLDLERTVVVQRSGERAGLFGYSLGHPTRQQTQELDDAVEFFLEGVEAAFKGLEIVGTEGIRDVEHLKLGQVPRLRRLGDIRRSCLFPFPIRPFRFAGCQKREMRCALADWTLSVSRGCENRLGFHDLTRRIDVAIDRDPAFFVEGSLRLRRCRARPRRRPAEQDLAFSVGAIRN